MISINNKVAYTTKPLPYDIVKGHIRPYKMIIETYKSSHDEELKICSLIFLIIHYTYNMKNTMVPLKHNLCGVSNIYIYIYTIK